MPKLIIIRGNSGSGKSTLAHEVREKSQSPRLVAIVSQDYLRRFILKEKESDDGKYIGLIEQTVTYCLKSGYDVILEGILYSRRHEKLLNTLISKANEVHAYYYDVSFEETLKRHETKHNSREFGEEEMKQWFNEDDSFGYDFEKIIPETMSLNDTSEMVIKDTGL